MTKPPSRSAQAPALLPSGLRDMLPPDAAAEARLASKLMAEFDAWGYQRVKPPFIEFEETLFAGPGAALMDQTFRVLDPMSQQMMGVRPDITVQIARLAATRLGAAARPLRVSYHGQVLRVRGSQLRPERQFAQAGFELIGLDGMAADAEAALLAAHALLRLGIPNLSMDLVDPTLVPSLTEELKLAPGEAEAVRAAMDAKDAGALKSAAPRHAALLTDLLLSSGPADKAVAALRALDLPPRARAAAERMALLASILAAEAPDIAVTMDPCEFRGFEYHQGLAFSLFARGVRGELGRGGRYGIDQNGETATGCTLYLDTVMRAAPPIEGRALVYIPFAQGRAQAAAARAQGLNALMALAPEGDPMAEAKRLGCTHLWRDGAAHPVS